MEITIPWIVRNRSAEGTVTVMASRFELTSATASPRFLALALRAWWQALRAPGVVGVSLKAAPWKGTFWTLSSWGGRKDIGAYSRSDPHAKISRSLGPVTQTSRFVFYDVPVEPRPTWRDAFARLAAADVEAAERADDASE